MAGKNSHAGTVVSPSYEVSTPLLASPRPWSISGSQPVFLSLALPSSGSGWAESGQWRGPSSTGVSDDPTPLVDRLPEGERANGPMGKPADLQRQRTNRPSKTGGTGTAENA